MENAQLTLIRKSKITETVNNIIDLGGRKMKTKGIVVIMLITTVVLSLCGCSNDKGEIENLMTEFEYSCNELDIDAMLNCINPAISDKIKLATGIAGMFKDKDSDELTEELVGMLTGDNSLNADDFFSSIKIEISDIKTKKETGTANAIVEYSVAGETFKQEATFNYIYNMEKWYISSFKLK